MNPLAVNYDAASLDASHNRARFGLVIQGPRFTTGNGPNNYACGGFDSLDTVKENINLFGPRVNNIVLSTWSDSGFCRDLLGDNITLIESIKPVGFDYLNQQKQFISIFAGVNFLASNSDCTHVIKIRTDQSVPLEFIDWIEKLFDGENNPNLIVCSDLISNLPFYAGDFVFVGGINKILGFVKSVLRSDRQRVALNNSMDYTLKRLIDIDDEIANLFTSGNPLVNQCKLAYRSDEIMYAWSRAINCYVTPLSKKIFWRIVWRGRPMSQVFDENNNNFIFYEDCRVNGRHLANAPSNVFAAEMSAELIGEIWRYLKEYLKCIVR